MGLKYSATAFRTSLPEPPMRPLTRKLLSALLVLGATWSGLAAAHHSFAMFADTQQSWTGTVKKLEWTNPHIWLWIEVTSADGTVTSWGFEGASPSEMTRSGWTKRSVTPGETVTVSGRPLKDGQPGGSMGSVTRADGTKIGKAGGGYGGPPPAGADAPPPAPGK